MLIFMLMHEHRHFFHPFFLVKDLYGPFYKILFTIIHEVSFVLEGTIPLPMGQMFTNAQQYQRPRKYIILDTWKTKFFCEESYLYKASSILLDH